MALPVSVPRNQVARIAGALATAPSSASARPCFRTTTIGLPTAATASASSCCGAGTTISVRDCASPDMPRAFADREHDDVGLAGSGDGLLDPAGKRLLDA